MADWLEEFGKIVGTSKDVLEKVEDVFDDVIKKQDSTPTKIPAETESKPAAQESPKQTPSTGAAPSWLIPVVVIAAIVLLMR